MNKIKHTTYIYKSSTDFIGATSSTLCMIHCLLTPILFAAHATSSAVCSEIGPFWWRIVDFLFLVISFVAINFTVKSTSHNQIPKYLYGTWFILAILVLNNFFHLLPLPHMLIYIPALGLAALHLYNRRYCKCAEDSCCV